METKAQGRALLAEMEREVLAEGQEWMRKRLEEKMRRLAEKEGGIFPPQPGEAGPGEAVQD